MLYILWWVIGCGDHRGAGVRCEMRRTNIDELVENEDVVGLIYALRDEDWRVRRRAADVLGEIGDSRAVESLITALGDIEGHVRWRAAYALGKIGDVRAVEPLITVLGDEDGDARRDAAYALGKIGDPKAVHALEKAINDSDECVIEKAKEALDAIKLSDAYKDYLKVQALKKAYEESSAFISSIESKTMELKSSGVKIPETERLLEQAKAQLNKNNFSRADDLANRARKVANDREAEYDIAVESIYEAEEIVSKIRGEGVIVSDELLTKSKESLDDGDYEIGIKSAEEQKNLVMNRETRYREAMEHMTLAESMIEIVEGLGCEISSALDLLKEANSTFGNGNYEEAIEYTKQGQEIVKRTQEESKPEITLKFPEWIFKPNTWKRTEITITNTGSMHAKGIKIEPSGDIEFRRMSTIPRLERDETERMTIFMKPTVMGDVPIDIAITFKDALDRGYTSSKDMWAYP